MSLNEFIGVHYVSDVIRVNLIGVMHGTKLALEYLAKDGVVINVASMAGILPLPFAPTYAATKAGIINYTR